MAYTEEQLANMSDEDLMNLDASTLVEAPEQNNTDPAEVATEVPATEEVDVPADGDPIVLEDNTENPTGDKTVTEPAPTDAAVDVPNPADKTEPAVDATKTAPAATEVVDDEASIKAFHAKITAPFKANGREMQVKTPEEAIQLMQMGANYNKKMAAIRPNLQIMKSLETAGLMSQEKIDFLIDVMAKKPEAISKLVQDSGIDPLDISTEKAGDYRPTSYRVSDKSLALDEVLDDLQGSEHYARTLSFVNDSLDSNSKQMIADNPVALRNLHQHIADGVFDQVWPEVERQKAFGTLNGLTDLEAYRQVGEQLASSGKLQLKAGVAPQPSQATAPAKVVVPPKPKQADDSDRRNKRQAASPTKTAAPTTKGSLNPNSILSMSDEDILKLDISKFA